MKKRNLGIVLAAFLSIGLLIYFAGDRIWKGNEKQSAKPGSAGVHEGHSGGQKTVPEVASSEDEFGDEDMSSIEITPEQQKLIGVKTSMVEKRLLKRTIRSVGRIVYDERRLSTVNTKVEGWIEKLHVNYTGQYVKKGAPLLEIYSPELLSTQREFIYSVQWNKERSSGKSTSELGRMMAKDTEAILEASRQRLRLWDISEAQIRKIEETGKPIRTLTIYSPVNGYVVQKTALRGMRIMPGEKLFDIADLSSVWIISDIYEYEVPLVKTGQAATIRLSSLPGREFRSKVEYVYPELSGETRTAQVRFTIPNPGGVLKPQMFSNLEIEILIGKKLSIPDGAVIDTGTRQVVYVDKGDGYFEPREVLLGAHGEGFREVLQGLHEGEKVTSSATFLIDSEAQLKGVAPLGGHKH